MTNDEEHDALVEARELLNWVGSCAYMHGPVGTKAYFISDEVMDKIHELTKESNDD